MFKLLGRASSANVQKVAWALAEMDVPFAHVDIGGPFGGNRAADYLRLNPHGTVPTLIDDRGGTVVWESNTILRYLANRLHWPTFYPMLPDAASRADVERWMDWQLASLNPAITPLYQSIQRTPLDQRQPGSIEQHRQRTVAALASLDAALAVRSAAGDAYLCGDALTLADIALGPQVRRWFDLTVARVPFPALTRWYEQLCKRAAFRAQVLAIPMT